MTKTDPKDLLTKNGITLKHWGPQRTYVPCPKCSATRKGAHKKAKVLGVTIEADGTTMWGCNHCGQTGPAKGDGIKPQPTKLVNYVYRDVAGAALFRKVRNMPGRMPRFWLERLSGKNSWTRGVQGVNTKTIYRADEVAKAIKAGHVVCVVEGEKDADNLARLGFSATTSAYGASEPSKAPKWTKAHSEQLRSADIIVFNDNDDALRAHAEATCRLSLGVAKRVRRLDLKLHWPEIPKGGDVSDWLAAGHSGEELAALIEAAPVYVAETIQQTEQAPAASDPTPKSETDDDAELTRLARLPVIEYERGRKAAAETLGMRASMLDRVVDAKRKELGLGGDDGKQGRPIELNDPEPWPEPVGAEVLDEIADAIGAHVVMGEHQRVAVALWVPHCYLLDLLMISPRLAIRSAVKGSGKTTCLDVLARLTPRPLMVANLSSSAVFRVIAKYSPTIIVDEADTMFHDGDETLRGILNAGHRRGGTVLRSVGDDFEPRAFSVYAATIIALIGTLPGTLADRSVDIVLARRRSSEPVTPFRLDRTEHLDQIARRIARWTMDNGDRFDFDPVMPPGMFNRAADNWRPLLAIADAAGGAWPEKARKAAVALAGGDIDEVSRTELLLSDIRDIFDDLDVDEISSADLIEKLIEIVPRPWAEYGKGGKPITQNKLARLLKPLGVSPGLIAGPERLSGYLRTLFEDAFERYVPVSPVSPLSNLSSSPNPYKPGTSSTFATSPAFPVGEVGKCEKSNNDGLLRGREVGKGEKGKTRTEGASKALSSSSNGKPWIGLSQRAIDQIVREIDASEFIDNDDDELVAEVRRRLAIVPPEAIEVEVERVMQAWRDR